MKTNPTKKLPKGRVMFACEADIREHKGTPALPFECVEKKSRFGHEHPVAVLPCRNRKTAQALVRFWNMTEEEQRVAISGAIARMESNRYGRRINPLCVRIQQARAVLNLMEGKA